MIIKIVEVCCFIYNRTKVAGKKMLWLKRYLQEKFTQSTC